MTRAAILFSLCALALRAENLRPITERVRIDSNVIVPMRDGVKLYADVYRPAREGKFPVLVVRTPYGKQRDGIHQGKIQFAQRGYAVVVQDARGRFESEGAWDPFRNEAKDGYDTIEWAARQPWSNGKVGTEGGSYLGNVQWQAAALTPPSLVAVFPAVASTSLYHNTFYHGGAFKLAVSYGWGAVRMPLRIMYPQYWHTEPYAPVELKYESIVWGLPLETLDLASSHHPVAHWRNWLKHESYDDYWRAISIEEKFDQVKAPAHTHGGWFDLLLNGTLNGYVGVKHQGGAEAARRGTRMVVGPWGHGPSRKFGEVDFGPTAMRNLMERELRFFDYHLMGIDTGIDKEPPVEIFLMGINRWVHFSDWPIPGAKATPLYLASGGSANSLRGDGRLSFDKPAGAGMDHYTYDPNQPVPTVGAHDCCGVPVTMGPMDQRGVEARNDVLVYSSEFLKKPIAVAGPIRMKLHAATDGPDTDWFVKLVDVQPNGSALNVAEGVLRARFHKGLDKPELLKANQAYEFEVDMRATGNVFLPGHRIRVDITSSNFPQYDRNLNSGEPLLTAKKVRVARQTVFHTPERPSHIVLPLIEVPRRMTARRVFLRLCGGAALSAQPKETYDTQAKGLRIVPGAWRPHYLWEHIAWISPPWPSQDYLWLDFPEAVFSNRGLHFLSHINPGAPALYGEWPAVSWRRAAGGIAFERELPDGVRFGGSLRRSEPSVVEMELFLRNQSKEPLERIALQTCAFLRAIREFADYTLENKFVHTPSGWMPLHKALAAEGGAGPYRVGWRRSGKLVADWPVLATLSNRGSRLVAMTWKEATLSLIGNPNHPCMHADPFFPNLAPGEGHTIRGRLIFFEGRLDEFELSRYLG